MTVTEPLTGLLLPPGGHVVPVDRLRPHPLNPRSALGDLAVLVESIREVGILQEPTVLTDCTILLGHRRVAAAAAAGLDRISVRVVDLELVEQQVAMLHENLHRNDLTPIEEARAFQRLADEGVTQAQIGKHCSCSQPHVSKRLALLDLPAELAAKVGAPPDAGGITVADATELLKLKDHPKAAIAAAKEARDDRRDLSDVVERARTQIEIDTKTDELTAQAKKKGWKLLAEPKGYYDTKSWLPLATKIDPYSSELQVLAKDHRGEKCHAAVIEQRRAYKAAQVKLVEVCAEPARHAKKGDSELKVAPKPKRTPNQGDLEQRAKEKARRDAAARRSDFAAITIPKLGRPTPATLDLIFATMIRHAHADTKKAACSILNVEPIKSTYGGVDCDTPLVAGDLYRSALAVGIASANEAIKSGWNHATSEISRMLSVLEELGYELTEDELKQVGARGDQTAIPPSLTVEPAPDDSGLWFVDCDDGDCGFSEEYETDTEARHAGCLHLLTVHQAASCESCGIYGHVAPVELRPSGAVLCDYCGLGDTGIEDGPKPDLSNRAACIDAVLAHTQGDLAKVARDAGTQDGAELFVRQQVLALEPDWSLTVGDKMLFTTSSGIRCEHLGVVLTWAEIAHRARKTNPGVEAANPGIGPAISEEAVQAELDAEDLDGPPADPVDHTMIAARKPRTKNKWEATCSCGALDLHNLTSEASARQALADHRAELGLPAPTEVA